MKEKDINILLKKAEEMRALFVLGQSIIPFMEEIFLFVREVHPLLSDINISIEENLQKMPKATKHLSKVTEATEIATTEIMDAIDGVVVKADLLEENISRMEEIHRNDKPAGSDEDEFIAGEYENVSSHARELLGSIRRDSNNIMMALQVQDITSQQIAAVNHLLGSIQGRLSVILKQFASTNVAELLSNETGSSHHEPQTNVTVLHRAIAFDPDAVDTLLSSNDNKQAEVDEIIRDNAIISKMPPAAPVIAARPAAGDKKNAEKSTADISSEPMESVLEFHSISQDDIDMLFGSSAA